jgi:hypothetical protein
MPLTQMRNLACSRHAVIELYAHLHLGVVMRAGNSAKPNRPPTSRTRRRRIRDH